MKFYIRSSPRLTGVVGVRVLRAKNFMRCCRRPVDKWNIPYSDTVEPSTGGSGAEFVPGYGATGDPWTHRKVS